MKLRLSLQRYKATDDGGRTVDLAVEADGATTVGELASALRDRDPRLGAAWTGAESTLKVLGDDRSVRAVPAGLPLSDAALPSGATVQLDDAATAVSREGGYSMRLGLTVISGEPPMEDAVVLGVGSYTLGRNRQNDVRLLATSVSRRHATINVREDGATIRDHASSGGIRVGSSRVSELDLVDGTRFSIGDYVLEASLKGGDGSPRPVSQDGVERFNRSPRVEPRFEGRVFDAPALPAEKSKQPFPIIAMIAPAVVGLGLFIFTQNPLTLAFVALSPLLMFGTFLTGRLNRRRQLRDDIDRFETRLTELDAELAASAEVETTLRRREYPATAEVVEQALARGTMLWTRRPEHWNFLRVRLGTTDLPSRSGVRANGRDAALPEYLGRLDAAIGQHATIPSVPVAESLFDAGVIGIAGPADAAADVVRALASGSMVVRSAPTPHPSAALPAASG